jgi:hypothetical protein
MMPCGADRTAGPATRFPRVDPQGLPAIFRRLRDAGPRPMGERPCGGIGRRARLKIEFRKECWFDSGQGHQSVARFAVARMERMVIRDS